MILGSHKITRYRWPFLYREQKNREILMINKDIIVAVVWRWLDVEGYCINIMQYYLIKRKTLYTVQWINRRKQKKRTINQADKQPAIYKPINLTTLSWYYVIFEGILRVVVASSDCNDHLCHWPMRSFLVVVVGGVKRGRRNWCQKKKDDSSFMNGLQVEIEIERKWHYIYEKDKFYA